MTAQEIRVHFYTLSDADVVANYAPRCAESLAEALAENERLRGNEETMQVNADYCAVEMPKLRAEIERLRAALAALAGEEKP